MLPVCLTAVSSLREENKKIKSAIARTIKIAKSTMPISNIKGTKNDTQNHKMMPPQILKNLALK
jgi:hypothetical protein